jgi:hypothetical protein
MQCAAVRIHSGWISVPVHRPLLTIATTVGKSDDCAGSPPMMAAGVVWLATTGAALDADGAAAAGAASSGSASSADRKAGRYDGMAARSPIWVWSAGARRSPLIAGGVAWPSQPGRRRLTVADRARGRVAS